MIRLDEVSKVWGDGTVAVSRLSLEVAEGEVCVLVGPSGSGKTTTMRLVNRLVEPTSGRVLVDGRDVASVDVTELRRGIGYVIQQIGLFPHQLSGGQRQRVGVARALGADPPILLMDEPFGAIDPVQRVRLQDEFRALQDRLRKTVVFVTHDIDEAVRLGDRIAVLAEGGVLAQVGTPAEILGAPADPFVAGFVGSERGLRRLRVLSVAREDLAPVPPEGVGHSIPLSSSLEDALAALLLDDAPTVGVVDDRGELLGVLTPAAVHAAARRAKG